MKIRIEGGNRHQRQTMLAKITSLLERSGFPGSAQIAFTSNHEDEICLLNPADLYSDMEPHL